MHRKPVIVTFFDADEELPWWQSARRIQDFPHYRKLLQTGGITPVRSSAELQANIHRYLDDPAENQTSRDLALEQECGRPDGQASARVAEALCRLLSPAPLSSVSDGLMVS